LLVRHGTWVEKLMRTILREPIRRNRERSKYRDPSPENSKSFRLKEVSHFHAPLVRLQTNVHGTSQWHEQLMYLSCQRLLVWRRCLYHGIGTFAPFCLMGCIVLKQRKILGFSKIFVQECIFHSFLVHVFRLGCFAVVMKPALPLLRDLFRTQALTTDYRRHHLVLLSVACSGYPIIYVLNLFFYWSYFVPRFRDVDP
jgi:hypothetical protein